MVNNIEVLKSVELIEAENKKMLDVIETLYDKAPDNNEKVEEVEVLKDGYLKIYRILKDVLTTHYDTSLVVEKVDMTPGVIEEKNELDTKVIIEDNLRMIADKLDVVKDILNDKEEKLSAVSDLRRIYEEVTICLIDIFNVEVD